MRLPVSDEMKLLVNPYLLVLKQNTEESNSYSLQMLQVGHLETLKSPDQIHLFPLLNRAYQETLANTDSIC